MGALPSSGSCAQAEEERTDNRTTRRREHLGPDERYTTQENIFDILGVQHGHEPEDEQKCREDVGIELWPRTETHLGRMKDKKIIWLGTHMGVECGVRLLHSHRSSSRGGVF
eukprot:3658609-Prymnesium_polylepis.1